MTSMMINVDLTPRALKSPTELRTESITSTTPDRPSSNWKTVNQDELQHSAEANSSKILINDMNVGVIQYICVDV